jgi:hypothetical protein
MGKLHELLAVEKELEDAAKKILRECETTFSKKDYLFKGRIRQTAIFDSDVPAPADIVEVVTETVGGKIRYVAPYVERTIDAALQKELTNQSAIGTIDIDGKKFEDLPATFLLGLEKRLVLLRETMSHMPTLPPGRDYVRDETSEHKEIYKSKSPLETYKTEKNFKPVVLYEATKEHPAQVEKVSITRNIGMFTDTEMHGSITSAQKSSILGRIDKLIRATKKARSRANMQQVNTRQIGEDLMKYLFEDIL